MYGNTSKSDDADLCLWYFINAETEHFMEYFYNGIDLVCGHPLVQAFVSKQKNFKHLFFEVLSSFVFSMGIGYVFYSSECLVIPMLAHAAERFVTRKYLTK